MEFIDTHTHLDGEEFRKDLPQVIHRAKEAGVKKVFIPAINADNVSDVLRVCQQYPGYAYPMVGLQPEEVKDDWQEQLQQMKAMLDESMKLPLEEREKGRRFIAVGEVGLDFYWSREFEQQQLKAFEEQVHWAIEYQLPLMIHCRKAQNELLKILRPYESQLVGGVFHCFTGNQQEAREYLRMDKFVLGIGGVSTFKSSHLREDLPAAVPLNRIVLETDSPYMAPVPHRGERNESAFVALVLKQLATSYGLSEEELARQTNANVHRVFGFD
ncbi:MAG: TatD family hydrolase [Prevotella sp.]|jgi:TatD DNase family protein